MANTIDLKLTASSVYVSEAAKGITVSIEDVCLKDLMAHLTVEQVVAYFDTTELLDKIRDNE